jgi:hypothetical protein
LIGRKTIEHFTSMRLAVPVAVPRSAAGIGQQSSRSSDLGYLEGDITVGSKAFGQNQSDSPNWSLQDLPRGGPTSWTSPPIFFAQQFAAKPAVYVAVAGIESGANLDVDRFGFSVETVDINENGFKVTIRRSQGVLYGVSLNWLAYGPRKP